VKSVGTGSGPFTVHVYSVDTIKGASQHLSSTGIASPGGLRKHDFTLAANGAIAFDNGKPLADAGADQTLAAGAGGTAVATLNGSASDPDGDPVSFTWAGADAFARGATAQVSLPAGTHVLTLTVDDGRGGTGEDTVRITVTGTRIAATVVGKGRDPSGSYFVDVQLKNTGTGHARNLRLTQVPVRTLAGTGVVSYNGALSPALPIAVGGLDVDAATVIRFYLNVPSTVSRFSITETGSLQNVLGATVAFSAAQSIVP
jgi:hypothetical protein